MANTFESLTGKVVNGLRVLSIARRVPELTWNCACLRCSSQQTIRHFLLTHGAAKCQNANCGKTADRQTRPTAVTAQTGIRSADRADSDAWQHSQPRQSHPQPSEPQPAQQRRAKPEIAHCPETQKLKADFLRLMAHQEERGGASPFTFPQWLELPEIVRAKCMSIVARDEKAS